MSDEPAAAEDKSFAFDTSSKSKSRAEPKKKPSRTRRDRDDDEDDDDRPSRKRAKPKSNKTLIITSVAVGFAVLIAGVCVYLGMNKGSQGNTPVVQIKPDQGKEPNKPNPQPGPNTPNPTPQGSGAPAEIAELFQGEMNLPTPSRSVASLRLPAGVTPTALSINLPPPMGEAKVDPAAGKLTLDEIKKATVYIKVSVGQSGGTGSGFVVRKDADGGLVATNHHVIREALGSADGGPTKGKVTVVFDSSLPSEKSYPAEIIAFDPEVDLAILRVKSVAELPKPIDPRLALPPSETQSILTCGFPFGESLATGTRNPAITIGKGAVSSLRRNEAGKLAKVQLDASINPGNSGGPVVDPDGRLVGIAVATIKGSGIGLAIPAEDLIAILDGRIQPPVFVPRDSGDEEAAFETVLPVIDPLKRIQSISYHIWSGEGKAPAAVKDQMTGFRPLAGSTKFDVAAAVRGTARLELQLPSSGKAKNVFVQIAVTPKSGPAIISEPVSYRLRYSDVRLATDTIAMSAFVKNVGRYQGQTIALRGNMDMGFAGAWNFIELKVRNEADIPTSGFLFLTDQKLVTDFPEAPFDERVPVRLTARVGKTMADGRTPVRVSRVDMIGRGDRIVSSMPSVEGMDEDLLTTLNREPDRFVGQSVVLDTAIIPHLAGATPAPQLFFSLPNGQMPRNIIFVAHPDLVTAVRDLGLKSSASARVTGQVDQRKLGPARVVIVQKVELLTEDGQVYKVVR